VRHAIERSYEPTGENPLIAVWPYAKAIESLPVVSTADLVLADRSDDAAVYGIFIGGSWQPTAGVFENRNPARPSELIGRFADASAQDAATACEAAQEAAPRWRATNALRRAEVLFAAAGLLRDRAEAIGAELTREEGKTLAEGIGEVQRAAAILRFFAGECTQATGEVYPSADDQTFLYTIREPLGVVAVITPWNFPIAIPAWKIAPALAYGNTVVWKPSELTPLCAVRLVEALSEAGLPPGVLNLVTGEPSVVGEAITAHPDVDAVTFTGSGPVGRAIQRKAIERGVKVQLELGGKNPVVVLADANLEQAVAGTLRGAMYSTGQKCSATSRAIVHPAVLEPFTERLAQATAALELGDPLDASTDIGPVVSAAQQRKVEGYLDLARREGLTAVLGGEPIEDRDGGFFVAPTIYANVNQASPLARDEIFGPVLAVIPADDPAEAIMLANATPYGLSASVYTHDLGTAMRFARESQVGVVHINSETTGAEPHVPFGGMKQSSSHSREQGKAAREFFTDTKTVYMTAP
jgi:acyl-CoA reductase-like NAD-dependent aldehyde dehydrogenase